MNLRIFAVALLGLSMLAHSAPGDTFTDKRVSAFITELKGKTIGSIVASDGADMPLPRLGVDPGCHYRVNSMTGIIEKDSSPGNGYLNGYVEYYALDLVKRMLVFPGVDKAGQACSFVVLVY